MTIVDPRTNTSSYAEVEHTLTFDGHYALIYEEDGFRTATSLVHFLTSPVYADYRKANPSLVDYLHTTYPELCI